MKALFLAILFFVSLNAIAHKQAYITALAGADETAKDRSLQALLVSADKGDIPALAEQLESSGTYDNALFLLSTIEAPEAGRALHAALSEADSRERAGILNALADRGYMDAVADAIRFTAEHNPVKAAALNYLAKTSTADGCHALLETVAKDNSAETADACMVAAERNPSEALRIYKKLYRTKLPAHVRLAALTGLARTDKANRIGWLNKGLKSERADWRGATAKEVAGLPDPELRQFLKQIPSAISKISGQALLNALTDCNRTAGLDYIYKVFEGASAMENRKSALDAICTLGDTGDIEKLIHQLDSASTQTAEAVEQSLMSSKNPEINSAVLNAFRMKKESNPSYLRLVKIIANRNIRDAAVPLAAALDAEHEEIRTIALLALREKATARQLPAVFKSLNTAKAPEEAQAAKKALFTLSKKYPREAISVISSIYDNSSDANKVLLLQAAGISGDNKGLDLLAKGVKESRLEIRNNALRTLAGWKSVSALDLLATQCGEFPDEKMRVLAQRGYIRLCDSISEPYKKFRVLSRIKSLPMREWEQKLLAEAIAPVADTKKIPDFKIIKIGTFRSEACGVADFNGDGKLDIVASPYIYYAPDWKAVKFRGIDGKVDENGKGYFDNFCDLVIDVNKDGKPDLLCGCWFSKQNQWYENPGSDDAPWREHVIEKLGNHETGKLEDIDGDGKALEFVPHTHITCWYERGVTPDGKPTMIRHNISENKNILGVGVGDINGDGRPDVVRPDVWFEAPEDIRKGEWKAHPLALAQINGKIEHTSNIIVFDVDKDGLNDLIATAAHQHGIFWYQQIRDADNTVGWKEHVIDDSWTQAHYLAFADIDNDGNKEIITGKRFMAHNGKDPDAFGPVCIRCYSFTPGPDPVFSRHTITENEGISAGLNIEAVDIDGDGDLDLVTTGKFGGPVLLENQLK
ncbi:MAG: VCBS repeat-containing protein [Kiritimatiellia bacterium]